MKNDVTASAHEKDLCQSQGQNKIQPLSLTSERARERERWRHAEECKTNGER